MNRRIFLILLALVLVLMLAGPTLTAAAAQPDSPTAGATVVKKPTSAEITAMRSMLTRANRAAAKPLPVKLNQQALPAAPGVEPDAELDAAKNTVTMPSGDPDPGAIQAAQKSFPKEWAQMNADIEKPTIMPDARVQPMGTNDVYLYYFGNYFTQSHQAAPYRAVGKLYFTLPSGATAYCGASVISPNNIVVTAGHCIYDTDTNKWNTAFVFVPAERNAVAPYGVFPYNSATILTTWINAPNFQAGEVYDVGVLKLGKNTAGQPVTFYTGWLGLVMLTAGTAGGYTNVQTEIGYAGNLNLGSSYTYISQAETFYGGAEMIAFGTPFTSGSSGDPLIRVYYPFTSGPVNYVSGVHTQATTRNGFGPRFNSVNLKLLCTTAGC